MTLWERLKANKTGIAPDMFTLLAASKMNGGRDRLHELSGIPPLSFTAKGKPLTAWSITGNTVQNGTPTPENPVEVQAVGEKTGNLADVIRGKVPRVSDGSLVTFEGLTTEYVPFHTGDILSVSFDKPGSEKRFYAFYYSGDILLSQKDLAYGTAITSYAVPKTVDRIRIRIDYSETEVSNVMLNYGSTALPYEPYGYKIPVVTRADGTEPITTPIYLPTPLYSGEVLRSEGSRDVKWGVVDLGSLTWENEFDLSQGQIRADNLSNPIISTMVYGGNCYCQSYMYDGIKKYTEIKNNSIAFSNSKQIPFLRIKNTSYDNVQDLINSMSGVKLYYELAKPKTETFTAPQIPTINGTTVIDVDTAVKPESMTIKYRR